MSVSISGCLFVTGDGIRFYIAPVPEKADVTGAEPGNGLRPVNKVGVRVCVDESVGEGRKEIPRVQSQLTSSDLSLQAAIGLLSYLVIVCVCVCAGV